MLKGFGIQKDDASGMEISDLMMALVAVFMLGSVMMKNSIESLSGYVSQAELDSVLRSELTSIVERNGIELLDGGIIRFRGNFGTSKTQLSDEIKRRLDAVCAPLVKLIVESPDKIERVQFEGHANRYWSDTKKQTAYYGNAEISTNRAINTMRHCLGESFEKNHEQLLNKFVAIGYSFSKPILNEDGSPNWKASKRVDIVIHAKDG